MALIGAYSVLNKNPGRAFGGSTVADSPGAWGKSGPARGKYFGDSDLGFDEKSAVPNGYAPGYSWVIPYTGGGMASYTQITGDGVITSSNLAGGLYGDADIISDGTITVANLNGVGIIQSSLVGSGTITTDISALATIVAALTGTGTISNAEVIAVLNASADLVGSGVISNAGMGLVVSMVAALVGDGQITSASLAALKNILADLTGAGTLTGDITGVGTLSAGLAGTASLVAALGSLAHLVANLTGTGTLTSGIIAKGHMEADLTPFTDLSPQSLATAVWEAVAAEYNDSGTMGNKMNSAASAGDPWGTALPGAYGAGTAGAIVGDLESAVNLAQAVLDGQDIETDGMDTLTMRQALRLILAALAGKASGAAGPTITFRDALDHKDRIVADVDVDGNRTAVTLDVTD